MNIYEKHADYMSLNNLITEIGNSLGGSLSATQALLNGAAQDPELRRDLLGGMDHELRYLRFLYENWILYHTYQTGKLKLTRRKFKLDEWLTTILGIWQKVAPEKNLQWEINSIENLPEVIADADRLAHAIGNILYASILSSPPGAKITIETQLKDEKFILNIKDAGPKINPLVVFSEIPGRNQNFENHPRLSRGLGLGIVLAHRIVQAHNGEILWDENQNSLHFISIHLPVQPSR